MPKIKRAALDQLCLELDMPQEGVLAALRITVATITAAPHGIATTAQIEAALAAQAITGAAQLLKALTDTGTLVWSYGCIEGWRMR